eukprot:9428754-Prorocentrum_lima.AAC.1
MEFVVGQVDQLEQNLSGTPAQPVHQQPLPYDPELLGNGVPPGLQPRREPEDGPVWAWPSGQGPGGS